MIDGFTLIKEAQLTYYQGRGFWVRHDRTGVEIFKFLCDKKENFFSYSFKTPLYDNDTGVAHILEHCLLHGSKNFPDPELFSKIQQESPCHELNAATSCSSTRFYASSCVPKDFYNLLEMVGDSVFFPLLREEVFMQEGWRIELDGKGKPFINGVVYNEMNNDDQNKWLPYKTVKKKFHEGSDEVSVFGGNPVCIPDCNIEKVRKFHADYYVPANCMITLFGDLDLDEQLKILDEKLLCRLPEGTKATKVKDEIIPILETQNYEIKIPHTGNDELDLELRISCKDEERGEVNVRDDYFNLLTYALYDDLQNPPVGTYGDIDIVGSSQHKDLIIAVYNITKKQIPEAKKYLMSLLDKLRDNGIERSVVETFCANQDYTAEDVDFEATGEIVCDAVTAGWMEVSNPFDSLEDPEILWQKSKNIFLSDGGESLKDLANRYLVDNKHKCFVTIIPDKKFFKELEKKQKQVLKRIIKETPKEKILSDIEKFKKFQRETEGNNCSDCIPKLNVKDMPDYQDPGISDCELVDGKFGKVHLFTSEQDIKKKTFVSIMFPEDVLTPEESFYLSEGRIFINSLGFGNFNRSDSFDVVSNLGIRKLSRNIDYSLVADYCNKKNIYENRHWLTIRFSVFNRKLKDALPVIKDYIFNPNFNDRQDVENYKQNFKKYLHKNRSDLADDYARHHIMAMCNEDYTKLDYLSGCKTPERLKQWQKENIDALLSKFVEVYKKVLSSGAIVNVFASKEQLPEARKLICDFINDCGIKPLADPFRIDIKNLRKELKLSEQVDDGCEIKTILSHIDNGAAFGIFKSSPYPSKEYAAEDALLSWFSNIVLYEQIRKRNGVYDVATYNSSSDSTVKFQTFRDPDPRQSIQVFRDCLAELADLEFDEELVRSIIIRCYGNAVGDIPAIEKGYTSFSRCLTGLMPEYRAQRIKNILSLTPEDFKAAAERLSQFAKNLKAVIVTNDSTRSAGEIIADIV